MTDKLQTLHDALIALGYTLGRERKSERKYTHPGDMAVERLAGKLGPYVRHNFPPTRDGLRDIAARLGMRFTYGTNSWTHLPVDREPVSLTMWAKRNPTGGHFLTVAYSRNG